MPVNEPDQGKENTPRSTTRVLAITSGKGGVGKTAVVANIAVLLARMNKRVLILDADLGLANIDVVFGLAPEKNLTHFSFQKKKRVKSPPTPTR